MKINRFKNIYMAGFCILIATLFLLICTKSSPLYPINDWVDSNAFFTMGKGMMNGKVLYMDLFEQKGPLLYFIHGLAYLISAKSFLGVYIFEVIFFSVFLYFSNKIICLYYKQKYSYICLPIIAAIVLNLINFSNGDSAEEFTIPLLTITLYYLIKYFKDEYPSLMTKRVLFINGFIAGCVLWIKYSLLGFWFAFMMMIFISCIIKKQYKESIKQCIIFLSGMFVATIPWIIYFGVNGAIKEWIETYIFVNLNSYTVDYTAMQKVHFVITSVYEGLTKNVIYGILTTLGIFYFIGTKRFIKNTFGKISIMICILITILLAYIGGRGYVYYFFIFSPFCIFGVLMLLDIFCKLTKRINSKKYIVPISSVIITVILLMVTLKFNHNVYMLKINKNDLFQYKFAKIIEQTPNATLLNYGSLDNGLYLTTGIVPNVKHFEIQNIPYDKYPENRDEQNRYIKEGLTDYVVVRIYANNKKYNPKNILKKYKLVAEQEQKFSGLNFKYLLFKRKDID